MSTHANSNLGFRPMRSADMLRALQIISEYDEDDAYDARETYEESIEGQFVLTEQEKVIGVVGAKLIENTDRAYGMSWTYLQKSDRRTGKGTLMLEWMLEWLKEHEARKVFVQASDYHDPTIGDIYFDAREAYKRVGFMQELRQPDFYAPGEAMIVYGLHLETKQFAAPEEQEADILITDVDEIPETNDAFWVAWEVADPGQGSKPIDLEKVVREVRSWGGRAIYMAFPSDLSCVAPLMSAARFRMAGRLLDYYEDDVDEVHYRLDVLS
ncbi:GNAT family N-acetyltransferase [Pirellula sp. SH-Sr6A]|uniref:GNAT family N-acetyltransferase n=1 Tax=Pirellula sp. SH-Sr6A TaxID=1632865 RepID=UPI00197BD81B|nr:GNAT family N-acetyltransferase [Pirellula sp. SH-Sr6A]